MTGKSQKTNRRLIIAATTPSSPLLFHSPSLESTIPLFHHSTILHSTIPLFHSSSIPFFYHSIIPFFHHSNIPQFHYSPNCPLPAFTMYPNSFILSPTRRHWSPCISILPFFTVPPAPQCCFRIRARSSMEVGLCRTPETTVTHFPFLPLVSRKICTTLPLPCGTGVGGFSWVAPPGGNNLSRSERDFNFMFKYPMERALNQRSMYR